ncbi:uncharacterized protein ATNIH1004_011399 [Aspergillus tanneri]|uniref:Major facilitator superfamily (MFS) profile domain-containing protein n=1 Tax=Aspergillus tanneri TaxID=1220188 RepID=A0A5M9M5Z9_9EURO|nr:uncharacterized protein ATNIH1004_011399 [Aspergillus tanneri]KAA8642455.1 hypothetical protein ATNIH1004_011399 [Aspergillus tanneri]
MGTCPLHDDMIQLTIQPSNTTLLDPTLGSRSRLIALAGLGILMKIYGPIHQHVQYGALFLVVSGAFSALPILACWYAMNLAGHRRKSVGTAWQDVFGNLGGIIALYCFLSKDSPSYHDGYILCIAFTCFTILTATMYLVDVWYENGRRDRAAARGEGQDISEEMKELMGDLAPSHRDIPYADDDVKFHTSRQDAYHFEDESLAEKNNHGDSLGLFPRLKRKEASSSGLFYNN